MPPQSCSTNLWRLFARPAPVSCSRSTSEVARQVEAGQVIAELRNRQLVAEQHDLELAIQAIADQIAGVQAKRRNAFVPSGNGAIVFAAGQAQREMRAGRAVDAACARLRDEWSHVSFPIGLALICNQETSSLRLVMKRVKNCKSRSPQSDFDPFARQLGQPDQRADFRRSGANAASCKAWNRERRRRHRKNQCMRRWVDRWKAALWIPKQSGPAFELLAPHFTGVVTLSPSISQKSASRAERCRLVRTPSRNRGQRLATQTAKVLALEFDGRRVFSGLCTVGLPRQN